MMHYATISPVFNALEAVGNDMTDGSFASDGQDALFCQSCHTPIAVRRQQFPSYSEMAGRPSRDFVDPGDVAAHGLSCDVCHQVAHADLAASTLGDGIANAAFVFAPGLTKFGPLRDPDPIFSPRHQTAYSDFLPSARFCGTCHDVRPRGTDIKTGEPFLRLENLFTEWESSPYASSENPYGRVVSCQDCHMSLFPYAPPGTYPMNRASEYGAAPVRRVATHYFTGVDIALVDFPGQDDPGPDAYGMPIGQRQRRTDLLRAACTLDVRSVAAVAAGTTLRIDADVTNVGAGHNVPAGFSQERQVWVELTVTDATGRTIYESGHLVDTAHPETGETAPDGRLDDEDLLDLMGVVAPHTSEADMSPGPDRNQRPDANLGLMNFGNEFEIVDGEAHHEVFVPFIANHMNNGNSIPPLTTVRVPYDIDVPADAVGPLEVRARLRFRPFPPRFLRMLAVARPDLVDEALVDRNVIVDMAEAEASVDVLP